MSAHLTDDQLIDRLYGIEAHEAHLQSCAACAAKLQLFEQRRAEAHDREPAIAPAFLAAQRSQILERVERPAFRLHWVPAVLATALVATVALMPQIMPPQITQRSVPVPDKAVQQEVAEDQWFLDVFSLEGDEEPRAALPIRGLFEEQQ